MPAIMTANGYADRRPHAEVVANIQLGGEPEYAQADPATGVIYQNLEDTSELVVVDPQKQAVTKRYKLAPCEGPTGLALDAVNHRLFSACRSKHLVVLNSDTGEIVATILIGAAVDGAGYDPVLRRVYTANAVGNMTVIQQESADSIECSKMRQPISAGIRWSSIPPRIAFMLRTLDQSPSTIHCPNLEENCSPFFSCRSFRPVVAAGADFALGFESLGEIVVGLHP